MSIWQKHLNISCGNDYAHNKDHPGKLLTTSHSCQTTENTWEKSQFRYSYFNHIMPPCHDFCEFKNKKRWGLLAQPYVTSTVTDFF